MVIPNERRVTALTKSRKGRRVSTEEGDHRHPSSTNEIREMPPISPVHEGDRNVETEIEPRRSSGRSAAVIT